MDYLYYIYTPRFLGKDFRAVLKVEVVDIFGGKQRPIVFVWGGKHGSHKASCAGPRNHIKVICNSCFFTIQFLHVANKSKLKSVYIH